MSVSKMCLSLIKSGMGYEGQLMSDLVDILPENVMNLSYVIHSVG